MNSAADIKAFTGRNGGTVCTSSNAEVALEWAFAQKPDAKVLFLPDQHLGRNTAVLKLGLALDDCVVWNPLLPNGGLTDEQLRDARMILWKGHCSVHGRFSPDVVDELRATIPGVQILVHPECQHEVVLKADLVGSTEFIIKTIEAAPAGSSWAIGTELNLVKRLADAHPDKKISFLDRTVCYCSTMNRIDLPHFVWAMESLVAGSRGQPDPGRPADRAPGAGGAAADAGPAGQVAQGLGRRRSSNQATRASAGCLGEADPAAVRLDDPSARRQARRPCPGSVLSSRTIGSKTRSPLLGGDSPAVVDDLHPPRCRRLARRPPTPSDGCVLARKGVALSTGWPAATGAGRGRP